MTRIYSFSMPMDSAVARNAKEITVAEVDVTVTVTCLGSCDTVFPKSTERAAMTRPISGSNGRSQPVVPNSSLTIKAPGIADKKSVGICMGVRTRAAPHVGESVPNHDSHPSTRDDLRDDIQPLLLENRQVNATGTEEHATGLQQLSGKAQAKSSALKKKLGSDGGRARTASAGQGSVAYEYCPSKGDLTAVASSKTATVLLIPAKPSPSSSSTMPAEASSKPPDVAEETMARLHAGATSGGTDALGCSEPRSTKSGLHELPSSECSHPSPQNEGKLQCNFDDEGSFVASPPSPSSSATKASAGSKRSAVRSDPSEQGLGDLGSISHLSPPEATKQVGGLSITDVTIDGNALAESTFAGDSMIGPEEFSLQPSPDTAGVFILPGARSKVFSKNESPHSRNVYCKNISLADKGTRCRQPYGRFFSNEMPRQTRRSHNSQLTMFRIRTCNREVNERCRHQ